MEIENYDKVLTWSYKLAKKYVQKFIVPKGITSARKFYRYAKDNNALPQTFPKRPDDYFRYRKVWIGWNDFLGNESSNMNRKEYLSYRDAVRIVREQKIRNSTEYKSWKNRPVNLPSRPDLHYKEWTTWKEFLGKNYKIPDPRRYTKLKENDVRIIKHQLDLGAKGADLARFFGVSEMQISRIKSGENWQDI